MLRNHLGPVNDLKIRGSWGRLGNDRINDYLFQQTFNINSGNYVFNNALASGGTPGRLANPDISWETTEQTNVGSTSSCSRTGSRSPATSTTSCRAASSSPCRCRA
jgi:hypothetical protein